jgi:hypothetical protein
MTAGDHHGDCNDFDNFGFCMSKFEISNEYGWRKSVIFNSTIRNTIFLLAMDPLCCFLVFQHLSSTLVHQGR